MPGKTSKKITKPNSKTMNKFCEECGHELIAGQKFCEECGTAIESDEQILKSAITGKPAFDFFTNKTKLKPVDVEGFACGILFTNFIRWKQKLGAEEADRLREVIEQYTEALRNFGIYYFILDVADNCIKNMETNSWRMHVQLLIRAIKRIKSKLKQDVHFALLFGGHDFIPMANLENPMAETWRSRGQTRYDKDLDTDMPYSSLSVYLPEKIEAARFPKLPVGRIPTGEDTTVDDLINLLSNTLESFTGFSMDNIFSLSAYDWRGPSGVVKTEIGGMDLKLSPEITLESIKEHYHDHVNVHYFNLHGGGDEDQIYWVGDDGEGNPYGRDYSAFSPELIAKCTQNNILGVEACYGAKLIGYEKKKSILLTALAAKTVSFVGSSRTSLGPAGPNPVVGLADIMILRYLKEMLDNIPAGEAMRRARVDAFVTSMKMGSDYASALLTLLEFNLFGDPALFLPISHQKSATKAMYKQKAAFDADKVEEIQDEELTQADIASGDPLSPLSAVRQAVDQAQQRIIQRINDQVWDSYPAFKGIEPNPVYYAFEGKNYYRLDYINKNLEYGQYLIVNHDKQGKILFTATSK